jgi:signal transduction histidine kinase
MALAAALTVIALAGIVLGHDAAGHRAGAALTVPFMTLPVALRRRVPLVAGIVVPLVGAVGHALWDAQSVAYPIIEFLALYGLAVWTTGRAFAGGVAAFVAGAFLSDLLPGNGVRGTTPFVVVCVVVMVLVRNIVGDRERKAALAERERDVAAREAVIEERARIARELHDAIAHHVSMVVMQAGAERRVLETGEGSPHEVLTVIEQVGRGALTEMRRMIGMLRSDDRDPRTPQPGLGDVALLIAQVREAGLPVTLTIEGSRRALPLGVELSAYRIIQEALTNALKHAGDAHASVLIRYGQDTLELEITDDGSGRPPPVTSGGHGLLGMRERVALYGGELAANRDPDRGFTVRVKLPIATLPTTD